MVYSKLDLATGYHQPAIEPKKTYRTAFKVYRDYTHMPFSPMASAMHLLHFGDSCAKCFVISWMTLLPFILMMFWFLVLQLKNMRPICVGFSINCENTR